MSETARTKNVFKTKLCNVLLFDQNTKSLVVDFDGYGVHFDNVDVRPKVAVTVRYKGQINKSGFECSLKR